jgi:hypothetical protein
MKKLIKFLLVIAIIGCAVYFPIKGIRDKNREQARLDKIKEGMYIKIVYEDTTECKTRFQLSNQDSNVQNEECKKIELAVREAPTQASKELGKAKKDEIYKVVEVEETDENYVWFRIVYQKNWKDKYQEGYIAQPRSSKTKYVEPYGIEFDYSAPTIACKDYDCTKDYEVESIDDINTDDVIAWDDQEGKKVTFEVFIEREPTDRPGPQYWVKWTVTDKKGKSASVKQRVIFKFPPSDSKVKDFSQIKG